MCVCVCVEKICLLSMYEGMPHLLSVCGNDTPIEYVCGNATPVECICVCVKDMPVESMCGNATSVEYM